MIILSSEHDRDATSCIELEPSFSVLISLIPHVLKRHYLAGSDYAIVLP